MTDGQNKNVELKGIDNHPIYFLGICDKFNEPVFANGSQGEKFFKQNLIGLRTIDFKTLFPLSGNDFKMVLLIDNNYLKQVSEAKVTIVNRESSEEVGFIKILDIQTIGNGVEFPTRFTLTSVIVPGLFKKPGHYDVSIQNERIGSFMLVGISAKPLTDERIEAIKSDPLSAKYIKYELKCNKCGDRLVIGAGIDKEGFTKDVIWYKDLEDEFCCSCKNSAWPLNFLRENLHDALGYKKSPFDEIEQIERNYSYSQLEEIYRNFKNLIENKETTEESIQKFIEKSPVILNPFNAELLGHKNDATTKYKTDFVIINQRKELILIEIERANLNLFKKDGSQRSELTHAINQVESWLQESSKNRYGFVRDLKIDGLGADDISHVRGVIIAGRTNKKEKDFLEKIYSRKDYEFYTYDDLLDYLRKTIDEIKKI